MNYYLPRIIVFRNFIGTFIGTTTVPVLISATDAATKAYIDNMLKEIGLVSNNYSWTVTDIDGNTYKTVTIGTQTWMSENLRVARYKSGAPIPIIMSNTVWKNLTTPGYCWYSNDEAAYKTTYGALYNWYTINTGNLCPPGWHIPSFDDWITLYSYLGDLSFAGGKLKETGTAHWIIPNTNATNETGFRALPGGYRSINGEFSFVGYHGFWWMAAEYNATDARFSYLSYYTSTGIISYNLKQYGFSVRCIKDN